MEIEVQSCKVEILTPFLCTFPFLKEAYSLWLCEAAGFAQPEEEYQCFKSVMKVSTKNMKPNGRCRPDGSSWVLGRRAGLCTVDAEEGLRKAERIRNRCALFSAQASVAIVQTIPLCLPKGYRGIIKTHNTSLILSLFPSLPAPKQTSLHVGCNVSTTSIPSHEGKQAGY